MRQIGGRYSDVEYLLFVFQKIYREMRNRVAEEKQKAGNMLWNAWHKEYRADVPEHIKAYVQTMCEAVHKQ